MSALEMLQVLCYFVLLVACTPLLGSYMAKVYSGESRWLGPIERWIYVWGGVKPDTEMGWKGYAFALLAFNLLGFVVLLLLQLLQDLLPLNPAQLPAVEPLLAFNTATSFVTNTNWQSYGGETTLSYLTQMVGLTVQNFVSAATGMGVVLALTRGLTRRSAATIGNFWVDLVRSTLYVLLPLSVLLALILTSQGVVQNLNAYAQATTLVGRPQLLPQGPAASQIAIKQLGTNGGGFFSTNSAHPYENPTPLTNFLEMFALLLIPAALTYTYGKLVGSARQGWAIFAAMLLIFVFGFGIMLWSEMSLNPATGAATNLEGKEVRFGVVNSVLWGAATTAASNGSVNAMQASFSPLTGGVAILFMMLGEVIFGGVGAGLYGMLMFVILTVFIAGLLVGRTPEYLGKKIEAREIKMALLTILLPGAAILSFSALAAVTPAALASRTNLGPHGLSEILYAFASGAGNNGSAFAGLNTNTPFYNLLVGLAMWLGRFGVILPALAIAGSMASKKVAPPSSGTFPTDGPLFTLLLMAVVVAVGALTFFPALTLGPLVEHLLMQSGRVF
ncbi:MAG: potassium-transporting ATPase subunit KdpA [Caldilineaceae bacterium]|nr:potassium-transporting ATPase subunit KdpA [Caldilineaceae bacterium]